MYLNIDILEAINYKILINNQIDTVVDNTKNITNIKKYVFCAKYIMDILL